MSKLLDGEEDRRRTAPGPHPDRKWQDTEEGPKKGAEKGMEQVADAVFSTARERERR